MYLNMRSIAYGVYLESAIDERKLATGSYKENIPNHRSEEDWKQECWKQEQENKNITVEFQLERGYTFLHKGFLQTFRMKMVTSGALSSCRGIRTTHQQRSTECPGSNLEIKIFKDNKETWRTKMRCDRSLDLDPRHKIQLPSQTTRLILMIHKLNRRNIDI